MNLEQKATPLSRATSPFKPAAVQMHRANVTPFWCPCQRMGAPQLYRRSGWGKDSLLSNFLKGACLEQAVLLVLLQIAEIALHYHMLIQNVSPVRDKVISLCYNCSLEKGWGKREGNANWIQHALESAPSSPSSTCEATGYMLLSTSLWLFKTIGRLPSDQLTLEGSLACCGPRGQLSFHYLTHLVFPASQLLGES